MKGLGFGFVLVKWEREDMRGRVERDGECVGL